MKQEVSRRRFLRWAGAGAAIVSLPGMTGCKSHGALLGAGGGAPGGNQTYFDRFGVDAGLMRKVIGLMLTLV